MQNDVFTKHNITFQPTASKRTDGTRPYHIIFTEPTTVLEFLEWIERGASSADVGTYGRIVIEWHVHTGEKFTKMIDYEHSIITGIQDGTISIFSKKIATVGKADGGNGRMDYILYLPFEPLREGPTPGPSQKMVDNAYFEGLHRIVHAGYASEAEELEYFTMLGKKSADDISAKGNKSNNRPLIIIQSNVHMKMEDYSDLYSSMVYEFKEHGLIVIPAYCHLVYISDGAKELVLLPVDDDDEDEEE